MNTPATKQSEIKRAWHLIDAKDKILGRLSVDIARLLIGKQKTTYTPNIDDGDYVVVINSSLVAVTGKKLTDKVYTRFSGFPSGLSRETLGEKMTKDSTKVITHAVKGMLPKNKLQARRMARLKVFQDATHPYENEIKNTNK